MKEIGGFFEFELKFQGREYHEGAVHLNLARNALLYLKETRGYKKIFIPHFLCDCIASLAEVNLIEISYYSVNEACKPVFNQVLDRNEAIWIVNYYGQLSKNEIMQYKKKWDAIILDNTHDFFSSPIDGIDTIYNARKYFGVADGGYLYTNKLLDRELEQGYSYERIRHLVGRFEKSGNEFYKDFLSAEEKLNRESLKSMSQFSKNILSGVDYEKIYQIRTKNFRYLHKKLSHINKFEISDASGTYMYPLWCENGSKLRQLLISRNIYIPILWPNVLKECSKEMLEYQMVDNILPIPIDQRYTISDMEYMGNIILDNLK